MDTEVDLTTVDRDVLIAIIAELQAVIERLQRRIAELAGPAKPGDPLRMPGLKAKSGRKPPAQQGPRQQRRHGFARPRLTPTHRVEHVMENCPDCGTHWSGGWIQRTREVIELPVVPVQVTEQVYIARTCPACRRRCTPPAELDGVVLGQQRRGVNLLSLIATLREEGRRPTLEYWSAISMLPTTIMMAPSSGAERTPVQARGRLCCGTSTTSAPATPKMPRWPDGPRQSTSSMSQPKPATITSHGKGVLPNWPGSGSCWPSAALSCLTRRLSRASCAGASSATSKACPVLDTGNSASSWPNRTCQRTTTRPSAACAIWSLAARSAAAPARSRAPSAR